MSRAKEVKTDRRYTKDHEWALEQNGEIVVGITAFAVDQLGDITLVNVDVKPGDSVEAHAPFGTIESVKTLSDLYAPVSGKVVRVNPELEEHPELVNEDPWAKAWMAATPPSRPTHEAGGLLEASAYAAHMEASTH